MPAVHGCFAARRHRRFFFSDVTLQAVAAGDTIIVPVNWGPGNPFQSYDNYDTIERLVKNDVKEFCRLWCAGKGVLVPEIVVDTYWQTLLGAISSYRRKPDSIQLCSDGQRDEKNVKPPSDNASKFLTRIAPYVNSDGARNLNMISRKLAILGPNSEISGSTS